MISICIPVYNDDVNHIIGHLMTQCKSLPEFNEILIYDDASVTKVVVEKSDNMIRVHRGNENLGSVGSRAFLAQKAINDWILFLDADLEFPSSDFLKNYLDVINQQTLLYYGGVLYQNHKPKNDQILRWKYGRKRETRTPLNKEQSYSFFVSCHFLIKRNLALNLFNIENLSGYGMDIYLSSYLKKNQIPILYFKNPAIHLGLESNADYLKKSIKGVETTFHAEEKKLIPNDLRPVQRAYLKLKKTGLLTIYLTLLKLCKKRFEKNILSSRPSLIYLDLLKLYHYSRLKQKS